MSFYIGQKVVCVDDAGLSTEKGPLIYRGRVYVVREISECPILKELGLYLIGVRSKLHPALLQEYGYRLSRFRPLDEMKEEARQKAEATRALKTAMEKEAK